MHKLVPIYLSTLFMFLLYSSTNVKSQKEIMSRKSRRTYWYLTRKKGKRLVLKSMVPKKPKAYSQNWNIKNFRHWSQN